MTSTSATGGTLAPLARATYDDLFVDLLTPTIVSLTGLGEDLVRPRFQERPRKSPGRETDWCAVGSVDSTGPLNTSSHFSDKFGLVVLVEEEHTVMASFYGPSAVTNAETLKVGLELRQNRSGLHQSGLVYAGFDRVTRVPELDNNLFENRADAVFRVRRRPGYQFRVLSMLDAQGKIIRDAGGTDPASQSATQRR